MCQILKLQQKRVPSQVVAATQNKPRISGNCVQIDKHVRRMMDKQQSATETATAVVQPITPQQEDDWEFELDLLGPSADIAVLQAHLDKAPNQNSATAQFLRGYLAHHFYHSQ